MTNLNNVIEIVTPENSRVEYELAGLGSRFIAYLVDVLLQILIIGLLYSGMLLSTGLGIIGAKEVGSILIAIILLAVFFVKFGYNVFFEMFLKGASPGKKFMNLVVIKKTGESIDFLDSVIRNFLRLFDLLPMFFFVGSVSIILNKDNQRVGDIAANTIVVRLNHKEQLIKYEDVVSLGKEKQNRENIYSINELEYKILREFLTRKDIIDAKRQAYLYSLYSYFGKKFRVGDKYTNPYTFLNEVLEMNS